MSFVQSNSEAPSVPAPADEAQGAGQFHWLVRGILLTYVVFGVAYSVVFPMWQVTDEVSHYQNALHHARYDTPIPRDFNEQARQPRIYFDIAGLVLKGVAAYDRDAIALQHPNARPHAKDPKIDWNGPNYHFLVGAHVLRWLNVAMGLVALVFVYHGARRLIPNHEAIAVSVLAMAALLPAFIFRNMQVSNDGLANLGGAILFYLLSRICIEDPEKKMVALGVVCAVAFAGFIKLTLLPIALVVLVQVVLLGRKATRAQQITAAVLAVGAAAGALVYLVNADSFVIQDFWRSAIRRATETRFNKDSLWQDAIYPLFRKYWAAAAESDPLTDYIVPGLGCLGAAVCFGGVMSRGLLKLPAKALVGGVFVVLVAGSLLNSWVVNLTLIAGAVGLYFSHRYYEATGRIPAHEVGRTQMWLAVWLTLSVATLIIARNTMASQWAHGRYFYAAIGPISLAMVGGWLFLLPEKWYWVVPWVATAAMLACNVILLVKMLGVYPL